MFCPKCGKELPENSKFCDACGENIAPAPEETIVAEEATPVVEEAAPVVEEAAPVVEEAAPAVNTAPVDAATPVAPKKKINIKKILVPVIAVVVIIGIVVGAISIIGSIGKKPAYVVMSDGYYELIKNIKKGDSVEIAKCKSDDDYRGYVAFSKDGKYIYYITKFDYSTETGTLNRAEYGKLKEDSSKNDKYIVEIAKNVRPYSLTVLDDNSVLYRDDENTLYHFTKKDEEVKIAKDVYNYKTDGDKIIYFEGDETVVSDEYGGEYTEYEYTLYSSTLKNPDDKEKIASDISTITKIVDVENVFYTTKDDGEYTTYLAGASKEPQEVGGLTSIVDETYDEEYNIESLVLLIENEKDVSLYDFVKDSYAAEDAKIKQPKQEDFETPVYYYDRLSSGYSYRTYDKYYTSCTKELNALYGWFSCYNMEEAVDMDWGDDSYYTWENESAAKTALNSFISKYKGTQDDNGYILVTDEIEAELNKIAKYISADYTWKDLSYGRYEAYTTTDWTAYYDAENAWTAANNRNQIRDNLKNEDNNINLRSLYTFKDGKLTVVTEDILAFRDEAGALVYSTNVTQTKDIADLSVYSDFSTFNPTVDFEEEVKIYLYEANKTLTLAEDTADSLLEVAKEDEYQSFNLYFTATNMFAINTKNTLSVAPISGDTTGELEELAEEVRIDFIKDDTLYYYSDVAEDADEGGTYGDFCSYNKEETVLAKDVVSYSAFVYGDGVIYVATDFDIKDETYEFTEINAKGEETVIAEEISMFYRIDKSQSLVINDGDLCLYKKGELTPIKDDVDYLWVKDCMYTIDDISYTE